MPPDIPARRKFLVNLGATSLLSSALLHSSARGQSNNQSGVLRDPPREFVPSAADLGSNFGPVSQIAASCQPTHEWQPGTAYDEAYRAAARARVKLALSYDPPPVDMAAEVVERIDCGEYFRERIVFSSTPWFRIAGYLLLPKTHAGRRPAIVDLHSHGGMFLFGKEKVIDLVSNHPTMKAYHAANYDGRPTASELVRRGYVVISIDAFCFGERRIMLDEDRAYGWDRADYSQKDVEYLNGKCRSKESTIAKSLVLAATTWPGIVNYDDRRTIDYLQTRPEVDPERIGCCGISMGGYRSAYLAAMDERIRAAVVVGFMSATSPMLKAHIDTHSWIHFLPGLHQALDLPDVSGLTAPRGLFVQQCSQDKLFPLEGMQRAVERIATLYRSAGAENQFRAQFYDEPHRWTINMQDEAFAWLDQQLG